VSSLSDFQAYIALAALTALALTGITLAGRKLADKYGSDIRIVWYLLSLSTVCTLTVAIWARSAGAIDAMGLFQGQWGSTLHSLLKFMLDLDTDINVLIAILAIVVVPQAVSYLLSGLFGCASAPILVGKAVSFFVWSVVKSFVVAAGILLTVSIYGWSEGWASWNLRGAASMACLALMLLACLLMYRDIGASPIAPSTKFGLLVQRKLESLKNWLTRKAPNVGAQPNPSIEKALSGKPINASHVER
jgi:hypothetical protein